MDESDKLEPLYARIPARLKYKLEDIATARRRKSGARVTVTELLVEALESFTRREEAQQGEQEGKD